MNSSKFKAQFHTKPGVAVYQKRGGIDTVPVFLEAGVQENTLFAT